jgi:protein gp37
VDYEVSNPRGEAVIVRSPMLERVMGLTTIEWTGRTCNCVKGCDPVSRACLNCCAARQAARGMHESHRGLTRLKGGRPVYNGAVRFYPDELEAIYRVQNPAKFFLCLMGDVYHDEITVPQNGLMHNAFVDNPRHTGQFLTKRPHNALARAKHLPWPDNLWLGATVESEKEAFRMKDVVKTPAKIKFISIEPMMSRMGKVLKTMRGVQWVILGGESGPKAEPTPPEWFYEAIDVLLAHPEKPAIFFKQWGAWGEDGIRRSTAQNGNQILGMQWLEFPV